MASIIMWAGLVWVGLTIVFARISRWWREHELRFHISPFKAAPVFYNMRGNWFAIRFLWFGVSYMYKGKQ